MVAQDMMPIQRLVRTPRTRAMFTETAVASVAQENR